MSIGLGSTNMYDYVVKDGNGIKGLVDSGISEVPDLYVQPEHERITQISTEDIHFGSLPVIDVCRLDGPEQKSLVKAAEALGFFYVVNHGFSMEFLEKLKSAAHRFFNQPAEKKKIYMKVESSKSPLTNYGTSFVPEKENVFQWKDYFSMAYTNDDDALRCWPDPCKEEALGYLKTTTKMAKRILEVLVENLGQPLHSSFIDTYMETKVVNMNFYPVCPDPRLTVGIGRHSDVGTLTVLLQDGTGGLSIRLEEDGDIGKKGEWIEIPPVPGALLVNIGDTLQILSNGRYRSAEHQVRAPSLQSRVSIPCFFNPPAAHVIGPLPQLVEKDGGTIYRECLFGDYKTYFFGQAFKGKGILDFAKITSS